MKVNLNQLKTLHEGKAAAQVVHRGQMGSAGGAENASSPARPGDKLGPAASAQAAYRDGIRQVIDGLGHTQKLILVLYHYEEMTIEEVGLVLGLSEQSVSETYSRIVAQLKAGAKATTGSA